MSYQDRKDIDTLYDLVWDNESEQTQFITREEFDEFKKYIKSNYSLSVLTDAIASNMDENGLTIFTNLQDGLQELETNLDGLQSNLTNLSGQLNGDSTHTGFVNVLTNLQHHLYGEGDEDGEGNPYTYTYPSSSSLKGLLDALRGSLGELSEGDTQLAVTLSDLKSKLIGFSGNLTQFRDQIRQELGDTAYEQLNQDLLELIFNIASTNDQIDNHHQRIQATETLIGSETDSASTQDGTAQNPYTVYGILNDTSDVASEANDSANELIDTIYRGTGDDYDPNADPEHPADNTTLQWLGDTSNTAVKVDGLVGNANLFAESTISQALKNHNDKIGDTSLFDGSSLSSAMKNAQSDISSGWESMSAWESKVGSVDPRDGTLQQQIANVVNNLIFGSGVACTTVQSISDRDNLNPRFHHLCYVVQNGKFYEYTGDDLLG